MTRFRDYWDREVELTEERWGHIVKEHPEIEGLREQIGSVLNSPDYIKVSLRDKQVWLYYKYEEILYNGKHLLVVVKMGKRSFVVTCYITDKIKEGDTIWQRT